MSDDALLRGFARVKADMERGPNVPAEDPRGPHLTIGTSTDCDWVVTDQYASRLHATIYRRMDGSLWVRSEGALNGLWVNGRKCYDIPIKPGDQLTVGRTTLTIPDWPR